ncbi:hypothetical protein MNBD_GAMMA16-377 [hydrothermal vent metagenome]|uniref:Uncharacterized protein n=1 Tax=hydrothermal vent metagenome TaxID=652676 RepID=A0A3B0Z4T5_9ZZZZ
MFAPSKVYIAITIFAWISLTPVMSFAANDVNPQTFNFNFTEQEDGLRNDESTVFCNIAGQADYNCQEAGNSQWYTTDNLADDTTTSFLQEQVVIDGVKYYHLVVGSKEEGFVQEIYMKMGNWRQLPGVQRETSFSGGRVCLAGPRTDFEERAACNGDNNGGDPLRADSVFTGNGTGNPEKMVMRQFISDEPSGFTQEFLKDQLTQKPIISQDLVIGDVNLQFVMDMSNSDYNTDDTAGIMINKFVINDPNIPGDGANFDFAVDQGAGANVTGGRYKFERVFVSSEFITGLDFGEVDFPSSIYTYFDGSIDPVLDINWEAIKQPNQNIEHTPR